MVRAKVGVMLFDNSKSCIHVLRWWWWWWFFIRYKHRGSTGPAEPLLRTTATTNMAAANFVVITNGEGCALTGTADIDQSSVPHAFFPRVAIGCRLSLKIDWNLEGPLSVATWDDTAWIGGTASGTLYRSVDTSTVWSGLYDISSFNLGSNRPHNSKVLLVAVWSGGSALVSINEVTYVGPS